MRHTKWPGCLRVAIAVLGLTLTPAMLAAGPKPDLASWDNLKTLAPGEQIHIVLKDVKSNRGTFQAVSDDGIVVRLETGDHTFTRQNVLRVSTKGQSHRLRNALLGAAIGAGAGLGVGAGVDAAQKCVGLGPCLPNLGAEVGTPLGAIVGAVVGVAIPSGRWHDVYRAQ